MISMNKHGWQHARTAHCLKIICNFYTTMDKAQLAVFQRQVHSIVQQSRGILGWCQARDKFTCRLRAHNGDGWCLISAHKRH